MNPFEKIEHEIMLPLIEALEKALVRLRAVTRDEQLEADGWIRHTGDVCPVHPKDRVIAIVTGQGYPKDADMKDYAAREWIWDHSVAERITHYKVTKKYVEPKPAKKLVDWSCPLLKGCNTNYGELFELYQYGVWLSSQGRCPSFDLLRVFLPPTWQVYHQGETNLQTLHDAGFEMQLRVVNGSNLKTTAAFNPINAYTCITAYRVIGIREGFTGVPESAT